MDKTDELRKLRKEIQENTDLPQDKAILVKLLNELIRSNELVYRYDEYYRMGYNLGYFLIQSQRIENTVAGTIDSAETLRSRKHREEKRAINLSIPLGSLIDLLGKYINGNAVLDPLREFNQYRIRIIHRLSEDFSKSLNEIEQSIAYDYPPERINDLQNILIEVTARIGQKSIDLMDEKTEKAGKIIGNKIADKLLASVAMPDLEFTIVDNPITQL